MDYQAAKIEWEKHKLDIEECTCNECEKDNCPYRFDIYNYGGDCIMEK